MLKDRNYNIVFSKEELDKLHQVLASHIAMCDQICNEDCDEESEWCTDWLEIMDN